VSTSPSSGKRPTARFEKITEPSRSTSNCDFSPGWMSAVWSVVPLISAARLAALVSYPLQVGQ